ncbi:MAG: SPOR domain-containing protein [Myxococcota bacterium]|nr:SPOR domain-containing protein [Myxococcota bacterium]
MPDLVHARREIWITRGHLMALGTATFFIAVLAFFIGIQVGRSQTEAPEVRADAALVPDGDRQDALEALLREVEAAQNDGPELAFNETLAENNAPEPPVEAPAADPAATEVPPADAPPPPPPVPKDAPMPKGGWAIQVASYDTVADADTRVQQLKSRGLSGYRVGALIRGKQWYRVRIGGYNSKAEAETAQAEAEAIAELRAATAGIALNATRRLLAETVTEDKSTALIDEAIDELPEKLN